MGGGDLIYSTHYLKNSKFETNTALVHMIEIENNNSLEHAFHQGINLFVGAGFSILAKDRAGKTLPLGRDLANELAEYFGKPKYFELPQLCSILTSTAEGPFYEYLTNRFTVEYVDPLYYSLQKINIKSVYTTNIDNLIFEIYKNVPGVFINNLGTDGKTTDPNSIDYLGLHGSIETTPHKFIFDVGSLATIFSDAPRIWGLLAQSLEQYPTVFVGYGFNDNSVLQTLLSQQTFTNARKDIWVVLRDEDQKYAEYYQSLGFHVIKADIKDFLKYLGTITSAGVKQNFDKDKYELLKPFLVPHNNHEVKVQRPIKEFFEGSSPFWCDILSGQICRTHHLANITNCIYERGKNTIIIGAPVSGKSTLLMQAAKECDGIGMKLFFNNLTQSRAKYIAKLIGKDKAVVFIDNLYDSIDAIKELEKDNIKIVSSDRSHYYGIISNLLDEEKYTVYNVTALSDQDLQSIFKSVPESIRGNSLVKEAEGTKYDKDTLFEFVSRNVNKRNVKERYTMALRELETEDQYLAEFLVLCAYMHSCHVPLPFEVAYDYFDNFNAEAVFSMKEDASDIIKDYIPEDDSYENMNYYYPRSRYIADVIVDACSSSLLSRVLNGVLDKVPYPHICDYKIFHKYAFDKNVTLKAFTNWRDGKAFYEKAFIYDNRNPYVLQQGALYLSQKRKFDDAFSWIDRAISMTDDKYFSIRNSHAVILFNANIEKNDGNVREQLDKSMLILEKCMNADLRKRFHARIYASQAIQYYGKFNDEKAVCYLKTAHNWLDKIVKSNTWDDESEKALAKLNEMIIQLGITV